MNERSFNVKSCVRPPLAPEPRLNLSRGVLRSFPVAARYLIGVSGGRDSVALLHLLLEQGYQNLVVCHLNHRLRGRAAAADARFVEQLASKLKLRREIARADVATRAKQEKISFELAARRARHEFFAAAARKYRTRMIFLGHQADDLVETLLINLFRGAGPSGLAAMREVAAMQCGRAQLTLIRPMLAVWRADLDLYLKARALSFRDDASNADLAPLRNRIRHRVLPYLERTLDRNVRRSLWRCALIAAEEEAFLQDQVPGDANGALSVTRLRLLPLALQRRLIGQWLREINVPEIGFDLVERVRALAELDGAVAKVNLPRHRHAFRRRGMIFVE